jgi:uncharacterized protein YlxW (UPF0749 family)
MPDEPTDIEAGGAAEATGRDRLVHALRQPRRGQVLAAVLLAVVGFAAVTQVRTNVDDSTYAGSREQDLIDILTGLAGTTQRAQSQLADLQQTKRQLESDTSKRQAAIDQAQQQVDTLNVLAGLVPVTGPGITITITEEKGHVTVQSFLDLIEELRSQGAEAIDVNGKVRLVGQSSFEQAPDGLYIDGQLITPPYRVQVIGEPATMEQAVVFARGPEDELKQDGAAVDVRQVQSLDIRTVRPASGGQSQ